MKLSEAIRKKLRQEMWTGGEVCPSCHRGEKHLSLRDTAKKTGLNISTLSRFLNGKSLSSEALDVLYKRYFGEVKP